MAWLTYRMLIKLPTISVRNYIRVLLEALDAVGVERQGRRFITWRGTAGSGRGQVCHAAVVVRVLVLLRPRSIP